MTDKPITAIRSNYKWLKALLDAGHDFVANRSTERYLRESIGHIGVLFDRLEAVEEKLAWGVSLPKITKELHDEFGDTCLMDVDGWSQVAVDFAGVLNSTLP